MGYFYCIFFALSALSVWGMYLTKVYKKENPVIEKVAKIAVIVWMSLYFLNLFLPDTYAMRTFNDVTPFESGENIWFILLRWCNDVAFIALPVAVFFKKDIFNKIVSYFLTVVCIANAAVFFKYIEGYTNMDFYALHGIESGGLSGIRFWSEEARAFFFNPVFRGMYFGVSMYLELMLIAFITLRSRESLVLNKNVKSVLKGLGVFALVFFSIMPIYAPQFIFKGYSKDFEVVFETFKMGTFFHFAWIIFVVLEGVALTLLFKKKSYEDRYIVILTLALSLLMQYNQMFTGIGELTTHRMPFQLCNMAPVFILIMLLTRSERVYHFTLVINAVGAIIAMAMCDTSPFGVTYIMNIHYIAEHTNVILAPILCATLGLFGKLETKHIKDFIIGFTIYFAFIFVLGGIFNGLEEATGNDYWDCNYLFMFDKESTTNIVGFVAPLFDIKFKLFNFFTISLVQFAVYAGFLAICTGAFFLMKWIMNGKKQTQQQTEEEVLVEDGNA